jgi:DNA polymerase-3 subunit epsilon
LINPGKPINPFIASMTGISNATVQDAPAFEDIYTEIEELLADRIFVAHNVSFDYSFIKNEFLRLDRKFNYNHFCSVRLSRALFPEYRTHGLDAIINRFGILQENRHRALPDAEAIQNFLQICMEKFGFENVESAIKRLLRTPSLPSNVPDELIKKLPNTVGVYIFYDSNGLPIYVGKSINIKDRVKSHFYEDTFSTKELRMKQQVAHIEARICAGELQALLMESKLVKEMLPVYNRQLRRNTGIWILRKTINQDKYIQLIIENVKRIDANELDEVMAVAKSKIGLQKTVERICKENQLCQRLCGVRKGKGACFAYQLKNCLGACKGIEKPEIYNFRVLQAFKYNAISKWPFSGQVVVAENNIDSEMEVFHLIDKWILIGSANTREELSELQTLTPETFSLDEYKILKNFLKRQDIRSEVVTRPVNQMSRTKVDKFCV